VAKSVESWRSSTLRKYALYLGAAAAAIPAGVAYAAIVQHGFENWWTVLLSLIAGILLAHLGYTLSARILPKINSAADSGVSRISVSKASFHPTVRSR
jgi:hypothetical protein